MNGPGADIADPVMPDGEEASVCIQRQFGHHGNGAAVIVTEERLRPARDPFHRSPDLPRGQGQGGIFLIGRSADAERAADILRVDTQFVRCEPDECGEAVPHARHALARAP